MGLGLGTFENLTEIRLLLMQVFRSQINVWLWYWANNIQHIAYEFVLCVKSVYNPLNDRQKHNIGFLNFKTWY